MKKQRLTLLLLVAVLGVPFASALGASAEPVTLTFKPS